MDDYITQRSPRKVVLRDEIKKGMDRLNEEGDYESLDTINAMCDYLDNNFMPQTTGINKNYEEQFKSLEGKFTSGICAWTNLFTGELAGDLSIELEDLEVELIETTYYKNGEETQFLPFYNEIRKFNFMEFVSGKYPTDENLCEVILRKNGVEYKLISKMFVISDADPEE